MARALEKVDRELERASSPGLRLARIEAPAGLAERLLRCVAPRPEVIWLPRPRLAADGGSPGTDGGEKDDDTRGAAVGFGSTATLRASGPERFAAIEREARALVRELEPGLPASALRFFGGVRFALGESGSGPWSEFGDARFSLPRVLYEDARGGALLTISWRPGEEAPTRALVERVLQSAFEASSSPAHEEPRVLARRENLSPDDFRALVADARQRIAQGELEKVVVARNLSFDLTSPPAFDVLLERLERVAPGTTRFAWRVGETIFFGATPELLVERRGATLRTEALAGSIAASLPEASASLLASDKDRAEHRFVVETLAALLAPRVRILEVPQEPRVRHAGNVLHLWTPLAGELQDAEHVLAWVARLHPTPAVGGVPQERALQFLRDHEQLDRGLYAAPLGFFDGEGNGEFVVALRSALLSGTRVDLYAGAGIVQGSRPADEFAETELKMSHVLHALGLTPAASVPS